MISPEDEGDSPATRSPGGTAEAGSESDDESAVSLLVDADLVMVSNRQPYRHEYEAGGDGEREITVDRPTGGLTAGLDPVMREVDGTWVAWGDGDADRDVTDGDDRVRVPPDDADSWYTLRRIWLSDDERDDYYYGYSNQVLWPLCHGLTGKMSYEDDYWTRYQQVNEKFAAAVAEENGDRPLVWLQDYHFALAPQMVRERLPDAFIMHFWHIPWPAWDTFRSCPQAEELLRGLLGNDLLGFHVPRYVSNFLECVEAAFDDAVIDWDEGRIYHEDRVTVVDSFPLGVAAEGIRDTAATMGDEFWDEFRREHGISEETQVALGVDRLDYTKGIVERLEALEQVWEERPEWRKRLTYVQNASESRSQIDEYQRLQAEVKSTVDRINERFATDDWTPVVYLEEFIPQDELFGLYRHSDVALVSPLRDGMNLVAQEYVASQVGEPGVLLLSEQAGAADVFGDEALTIDPYDTATFASKIVDALAMNETERERRMETLRDRVESMSLDHWITDVSRRAHDLR